MSASYTQAVASSSANVIERVSWTSTSDSYSGANIFDRRCPRNQCRHAPLLPGWEWKLCAGCLDQTRKAQKRTREKREERAPTLGRASNKDNHQERRASCYFCTAPIIIPPGHTSGPLVCEACYRRALAAKEKQAARQAQVQNIPRQAGPPIFAPPIPPQLPHLPASYTTLNLQGPSPGPPPGPPPMIVPSQARPTYPPAGPRYVAGKTRISEPPPRPKNRETRPPQMDVSKSLDRGSASTGVGLPVLGESASPGERQEPSPMNLPNSDQSEPLPKAEEPDLDLDDLDGLELAYPEDDEVASQSETVPATAEAQPISPPLPPPADLHQDVYMYKMQPQHEESTSATGPRSVFDLPDGWDSEMSDLTPPRAPTV